MVTLRSFSRYLIHILNLYSINIAESAILRLPSVQVSEPVCRDPPPSKHLIFEVWGGNQLIEFFCEEGFLALGPTFGSCDPETARWSVEPPKCVGTGCPNPEPVENGQVITKENGSVAVYRCNDGYKLIGEETLYCHKTRWSHSTPKCAERLPRQGSRRQLYQESSYNETLMAQEDYRKEALLADDTCYHQFRKPPKIEHSTYKIMYEYIRQKNLWGIIANYTCNVGYHLEDQHSRFFFCRWYGWRAKISPRCVEDLKEYDHCQLNNGGCGDICVSYPDGSYLCECSKGYVLGADKRHCVDLDECKFDNWNCEHYCVNVIGSYFCSCPKGYVSNNARCLDLDECATPESNDCIGDCINTHGSYTCNCSLPGFVHSTDKIHCEDVNECKGNNGGCEDTCVNEYGSYACLCHTAGYQIGADKHNCTDIDECVKYASKICQNGKCLNTKSSYTCECQHGYQADEKNMACQDVNECVVNNGGCAEICINIHGSYLCVCPDAGFMIKQDGHSCEDINECEMQTAGCEDECINVIGSFFCFCNKPFTVLGNDSRTCTYCNAKQYYNDTSYQCEPCPTHSLTSSPYSDDITDCVCEMGYTAKLDDAKICDDIDECLIDNNGCEYKCENVPGSAYCMCADGYQLLSDGKFCRDINECLSNNGNCAHICTNTDGSFLCDCKQGFTLDVDRHSCEDIDECYSGTLKCSNICENTIGSAHCVCEKGFKLNEDNQTCADIDECMMGIDVCEDICINTMGSYLCECSSPGLKLSWDLASCADINECMEGGQTCHEACINTHGSFRCSCFQDGYLYEADNRTCHDIDECQSNNTNTCQQICINSDGSYTCDCYPGFSRYSFNECLPCAEGFYKETNDIECQPCPSKSSTNGTGHASIKDCICQDGHPVGGENGYSCNATESTTMRQNE